MKKIEDGLISAFKSFFSESHGENDFEEGENFIYAVVKGTANELIHYELIHQHDELHIEFHIECKIGEEKLKPIQAVFKSNERFYKHYTYYSNNYWQTRTPVTCEEDVKRDLRRLVDIVAPICDDKHVKLSPLCFELSLREIADWQLNPDDIPLERPYVEVPNFQRGLVWNAAQIEVLWDSLLRGIPIGSFSLLPAGDKNYAKNGKMGRKGYWLLDGQQRSNAIALGFADFPKKDERPHAILWIDILPQSDLRRQSNRKYFFYVTTEGRPWGYKIADANGENHAGKVAPKDYLPALTELTEKVHARPSVCDLWPVSANLPVPFCVFRTWAESDESKDFITYLRDGCAKFKGLRWYDHFNESVEKLKCDGSSVEDVGEIRRMFRRALEMRVLALVAPRELSQDGADMGKSNEDYERDSEIAVFFARLNKNGTPPSPEDLNYSILKSVNPSLGRIDKDAEGRMHPARLANLAMRCFKSEKEGMFIGSISRRDAFSLGREDSFIKFITADVFESVSQFRFQLNRVDEWLGQIPPVLRTTFSRYNPNLYQMLILLAGSEESRIPFDSCQITALTTFLAWFGDDGALDYATLYSTIRDIKSDVAENVRKWLFNQIECAFLNVPPSIESIENFIKDVQTPSADFESVKRKMIRSGYWDGLNRLWRWDSSSGRGLLLYACQGYLEKEFEGYDPASAVWSEDSRPWDYDHIIPQNWLITGRRREQGPHHRLVDFFLNSIGNIAPIPFSLNRKKHDLPPDSNYLGSPENRKQIFFFEKKCAFFDKKPNPYLEWEDGGGNACLLAGIVLSRFEKIYKTWYYGLKLPDLLDFSSLENERSKLEEKMKAVLSKRGCSSIQKFYLLPDGTQGPVDRCWDYARPWFACGTMACVRKNNVQIDCFACVVEQNGKYESGLRRPPESNQAFEDDGEWWIEESYQSSDNLDAAIQHFESVMKKPDVKIVKEE